MKIYKTIIEAKEENITWLPGIYFFKNKLDNKYYIGQALCIRKRFQNHYFNIIHHKHPNPLYNAINKYGLENFEYGIIGVIRTSNTDLSKIKKVLDKYEIEYINKYNSYKEGYNKTQGGDCGVLGYKMTEEQKKKIGECSKQKARDGRNKIYVYNINTKERFCFSNFSEASEKLDVNKDSLYSAFRRNSLYKNTLLIKKSKEEIEECINNELSKLKTKGHKYSLEEYIKIKEKYPNVSLPNLAKMMGICKKTIYNYENKLKINGYKVI